MPATNKLRINTRLTNASVEYKGGSGFVADVIAPVLLVDKQAGLIMEADKSNLMVDADGDDRIGQGEEPPTLKGDFSDLTFATVERARGTTVHDDEVDADNAEDAPYEVKVRATELATMRLQRNREVRVKTKALAGATGASPATKWDSGGDPVADVREQKVIAYNAGVQLNHMVIPWLVVEHLKENAALKDYFKGGATVNNPALVDVNVLRAIFGIQNIHVADAHYVSGNMVAGPQSGTVGGIWTDDILMFYRPERPMRRELAFMYTYAWRRAFKGAAANAQGQVVTEHYEPRKRTLFIDARTYRDEKVLVAAAARKLTNVLAGV
ncbi:hypothetical protein [Roseisolibacter agri]|uniref:Major capsid protein n=1 Tax=Roseisolibacter agri TaxID=2014610 RepID=A0AA37Q1W4_9BACT|nr:hypothetical protein [Roseisolibacter agri]GLC25070.1 hypothetical protein rosag_15830 [Roseisolibacter agri]